jgi:hypothetical protein
MSRRIVGCLADVIVASTAIAAMDGSANPPAHGPGERVTELIRRVGNGDVVTGRQAVIELGLMEKNARSEAVPALRAALSAPGLRRVAAQVLRRVGGSAADPALADYGREVKRLIGRQAAAVMRAFQGRSSQRIAPFVHPVEGVRFSPSPWVEVQHDAVLAKARLAALSPSEVLSWGRDEVTGEPLRLTWHEYVRRFVAEASTGANVRIEFNPGPPVGGTTTDNSFSVYPDGVVVEYRTPPDAAPNWSATRLVFTEYEGTWCLVAVIHHGPTV